MVGTRAPEEEVECPELDGFEERLEPARGR